MQSMSDKKGNTGGALALLPPHPLFMFDPDRETHRALLVGGGLLGHLVGTIDPTTAHCLIKGNHRLI